MKNLIRNVWVCLGLMVLPFTASGQQKDNITYVPAQELLLVGKATTEGEYFHRVDTAKYRTMPPTVKKLFTNSAGLAISFTTNSPVIKAKWMVPDNYQLPNLTRVAQKGLDLYIKRDGKWQFAGVGIPGGVTTEKVLVDNMGTEEKECLLYLPLYDELKSLEIGVSSDAISHIPIEQVDCTRFAHTDRHLRIVENTGELIAKDLLEIVKQIQIMNNLLYRTGIQRIVRIE